MNFDKWLGLGILVLIFVPVIKLVLDEFTQVGGIIQVVSANATAMGFSGDFELTIWKFWPILVLILIGYAIAKAHKARGEGRGAEM